VFLNSDTNSSFHTHAPIDENDSSKAAQIRSLSTLLYKIRSFYSDSLGQVLLLKLPDVINIGRNPDDECNIEDLHVFLLLLLGSAVQCEQKEHFIEKIKSMDVSIQHSIVECIQQITDNPSSVWINSEWSDLCQLPETEHSRMYSILVQNVNRLVQERDELLQRVVELVLELEAFRSLPKSNQSSLKSPSSAHLTGSLMITNGSPDINQVPSNSLLYNMYSPSSCTSSLSPGSGNDNRSHLMLELAEVKSKVRKIQQELEEKTELVAELKEILDQNKETCSKLRQENLELIQESRSAKAYRDEIDILNERVRKVDRLEGEVQKYRDKMNELEFCKTRIEEMREDNRILTETKLMLEDQLEVSRKRSEIIPDLEAQILQLRAYSNELSFQQDIDKDKIESLMEELTAVHVDKKAVTEELTKAQCELDLFRSQLNAFESMSQNGLESNLLEQLNNDAAKRVLKLELENQKLQSLIENMKNSKSEFISNSILNSKLNFDGLQKESKSELDDRLDSPETLSENDSGCVSLVGELNSRLEKMEKENQRLKSTIERLKESELKIAELEKIKAELEQLKDECKSKLNEELHKTEKLESSSHVLSSENQRLLRQVENLSKQLEHAQEEMKELQNENQMLQETSVSLKETVKKLNEMEKNVTILKAENNRLEEVKKLSEKEISRLKQVIELKDNQFDEQASKLTSLEIDNKKMYKEIETLMANTCNAKELEKENQEINQELIMSKKSLATLRQDLVDEKIRSQIYSSELEKISMALSQFNIKSSAFTSSLPSSPSSSSSSSPLSLSLSLHSSSPSHSPESSTSNLTALSEVGKTDWSKLFQNVIRSKVREIVEDKKEKIDMLEKKLIESDHLRGKLESELETVKQKMEYEETQSNDVIDTNRLRAVQELERRLKFAENENKNLKNENITLKENEMSLKSELKSVQVKLNCMSKQSNVLHSDQAKVQVENSLLLAQKTSLSSQTANLYSQIQTLEECKNNLEAKCKQFEENYQTLITDHQSLQTLHQQLANDYEVLMENHSLLKSNHKILKVEHKEVKEKLDAWLASNEELKKIIKDQAEGSKVKEAEEEAIKLRQENRTLLDDFKRVETELKMSQNIYKQLRKENNDLKLKYTEVEGESAEYRNKMSSLQIELSKLSDYCESLLFANSSLEEHRRILLSSVAALLSQYQRFITEFASADNCQSSREAITDLLAKKEKIEKMIKDYDLMSERKNKKIASSAPNVILAKHIQRTEADGYQALCPAILETKGETYDKLWESNTAVLYPLLRSRKDPTLESAETCATSPKYSPPPRPPPRGQALTTTVENKMTINVITSPAQKHASSSLYSTSSTTSTVPSIFVRSPFRSNSINIGSSLKQYQNNRFSQPSFRSNHYFQHYLHYYYKHHIHSAHSASPSINSEEDSELSDGASRINDKNGDPSSILKSKSAQASLSNSTWYEYGCV